MNCQKCARPAVVHLTEVVSESGLAFGTSGKGKRTVEIHLCLGHAVEAGLIVASAEAPPQGAKQGQGALAEDQAQPTAIVPASSESTSLAIARDSAACPKCGMKWGLFKQLGLMGCSHDYDLFEGKLLPLLKRAQEGASEHVGKVAARRKAQETQRHATTMHLRKQLQVAIDAEKYEEAATLRDQLRHLEQN